MPIERTHERLLASCLLKDRDAVWIAVEEGVTENMFQDALCRKIWKLLSGGFEYEPGDTLGIAEKLTKGLTFSETDALARDLDELNDLLEVGIRARDFSKALIAGRATLYARKTFLDAAAGLEVGNPLEDEIAKLRDSLSEIEMMGESGMPESIKKVAERTAKGLFDPEEDERLNSPVYFGLDFIDLMLTPVRSAELVVVAAPPSGGKTSLAAHIARINAIRGQTVSIHSLEMDSERILEQLAAQQSMVCSRSVREGKSGLKEIEKYMKAVGDMGKLPVFIEDKKDSIGEITASIRLLARSKNLKLAVIDYLQLVEINKRDRPDTREQCVAYISRQFKKLTRELGIPIIVLSQLNRDSQRDNRVPILSDLRESGAIEQDADRVLMLHRPNRDFDGLDQSETHGSPRTSFHTTLIQRKCRSGPKDLFCKVVFHAPTTSFRAFDSTAPKPAPPPLK
jgi:replicative DNA helicase